MTPNTSLTLEGAAYVAGFLFLTIAITCYVYQLRNQAQLWRRQCAACGSEESALRVLKAAEDLPASTDDLLRRGFRMAARNGLLTKDLK